MTKTATSSASWAQIVKGSAMSVEEDANSELVSTDVTPSAEEVSTDDMGPFVPGPRGSFQCFCRGTVLTMLSHYGWVSAFDEIDHPLTRKHSGRIYVQKCDVVDEETIAAGDIVSFYLYADNFGLGAEGCRLEEKACDEGRVCGMRADAQEFVPQTSCDNATMHGSSDSEIWHVADMYARMSRVFTSVPANGYVQMAGVPSPFQDVIGINSAYFDDEDSSEDGDDGDKESLRDDTDHSSVEGLDITSHAPWFGAAGLHGPEKAKRSVSPEFDDASTAAGLTSDSDWDNAPPMAFRPPPGLEAPPAGCFAPPGLPPPGVWA